MKITMLSMMFAASVSALAQSSVQDALVKHWKTSGEFTLAVRKRCLRRVTISGPTRRR